MMKKHSIFIKIIVMLLIRSIVWGDITASFRDARQYHLRQEHYAALNSRKSAKAVRQSLHAQEHIDPSQDFIGVDIYHFAHTQYRLAESALSDQTIYQKLAEDGYTKKSVDLINQDEEGRPTYKESSIDNEIFRQSLNARLQSVSEGVANGLDALDFKIGQFFKGIKQAIAWLEASGRDRIDVFSKEENGIPYQLTILQSREGCNYIQIKKISQEKFSEAVKISGKSIAHGTLLKITVKENIPRTDNMPEGYGASQEAIAKGVRKDFYDIVGTNIYVNGEKINGSKTKKEIVAPAAENGSAGTKEVYVDISDNGWSITDNGIGMNAKSLARMFVPNADSKSTGALTAKEAKEELSKVGIVLDTALLNSILFQRTHRKITSFKIPEDIHEDAITNGEFRIEGGRLFDMPASWDEIRIPMDLKPGNISDFQLAIEYAVSRIIESDFKDTDKLKYINTLILGIETLAEKTPNYEPILKDIRAGTQRAIAPIIANLQRQSFVILPHSRQFAKLHLSNEKIPLYPPFSKGEVPLSPKNEETRETAEAPLFSKEGLGEISVIFLNPHLFNWEGVKSLEALGGRIVPGITLGGDKNLKLAVMPFTEEAVQNISESHKDWYNLPEEDRIPLIKHNKLIIVPLELGYQLYRLAVKSTRELLSEDEEKLFKSLQQRINIVTAEEVVTSYEIIRPKENLRITPGSKFKERPAGRIDSDAINKFLAEPPHFPKGGLGGITNLPPDASQKHILLENGDIVEIGTGRKVKDFTEIHQLKYLKNGYYEIMQKEEDGNNYYAIARLDGDNYEIWCEFDSGSIPIVSADRRYVAALHDFILDMETGDEIHLDEMDSKDDRFTEELQQWTDNVQFSNDSRYMVYMKSAIKSNDAWIGIVDMDTRKIISEFHLPDKNIEYAINPFTDVAFVQYKDTGLLDLIDLESGKKIASNAKHLRTDSTGTYTVIVDTNNRMSLYFHKSKEKKIVSAARNGELITSPSTYYSRNGKVWFLVHNAENNRVDILDESGNFSGVFSYENEHNFFWTEEIRDNQIFYEIFGSEENHSINSRLSDIGPLQRLTWKGFYKDPHSKLFIDNSNSESPTAIDPMTGKKFSYKGELIFHSEKSGYIIFRYDDKYQVGYGENTISQPYIGVTDDKTPAHFMVDKVGDECYLRDYQQKIPLYPPFSKGEVSVFSRENPPFSKENKIPPAPLFSIEDSAKRGLGEIILENIPDEYIPTSFDGAYFLFTNPKTGDVIYLNPNKPQELKFVPMSSSPFSDTLPQDAPSEYVITRNPDGKFRVQNTRTGWMSDEYKRIERVNDEAFIGYDNSGITVFNKSHRKSFTKISVVSYNNRFIVIRKDHPTFPLANQNEEFLYDIGRNERSPNSKKIHLSASGRFSVHEGHNGDLVYYDHNQENPVPQKIASRSKYQEYLVSDRGDAVILKDEKGYLFFSLIKGAAGAINGKPAHFEHIEIDSSGTISILKHNGLLFAQNLKTEDINPTLSKIIQISSDEKLVYVIDMSIDGDMFIVIYDKETGAVIQEPMHGKEFSETKPLGEITIPRFRETYYLDNKTIFDVEKMTTPDNFSSAMVKELIYQDNPPTNPKYSMVLKNEVVQIVKNRSKECQVLDLREKVSSRKSIKPRKDYFKGYSYLDSGKIWYEAPNQKMSTSVFVKNDILNFSPNKIFINQSKRYILGEEYIRGPSQKEKSSLLLISHTGEITNITGRIPEGFVPVDVNGDYFVFVNPDEPGKPKFLNPELLTASKTSTGQTSEEQKKQARAVEKWEDEVLPKKDELIDYAQEAYNPFLALIPEAERTDIEEALKPLMEELYKAQEKEIHAHFKESLDKEKTADLTARLPFDNFAEVMVGIVAALPAYLRDNAAMLNQEDFKGEFYENLFMGLFRLAAGRGGEVLGTRNFLNELFTSIGLGYEVRAQRDIDDLEYIIHFWKVLLEEISPRASLEQTAKVIRFLSAAMQRSPEAHTIVINQIKKLISAEADKGLAPFQKKMCEDLVSAFDDTETALLHNYIENPDRYYNELGRVRSIAYFLTNNVPPVREKEHFIPEGEEIAMSENGVSISQVMKLEQNRPRSEDGDKNPPLSPFNKGGSTSIEQSSSFSMGSFRSLSENPPLSKEEDNDKIMTMDYLIEHLDKLPEPYEPWDERIRKDIKFQREPGASAAELNDNSLDAGATEVVVDFYIQTNRVSGKREYVQEVSDNGGGAPYEAALIIPFSSKTDAEQKDMIGRFAAGKYTAFEGMDRIEFINNNNERAYMLTYRIIKDEDGKLVDVRFAGIRKIEDLSVKQGLTMRMIQEVGNTIPELDKLMAMRNWKVFAGLSQNDNFKIYFINNDGEREELVIEKEVLSEVEFRVMKSQKYPKLKIVSVSDKEVPAQVLNRTGSRISDIKEVYLELIPLSLRKYIEELNISIYIPLQPIHNRSAFENEAYYLRFIQKYVAIEFYKALAYKTLTSDFVFENFSSDWETNPDYIKLIDSNDPEIVRLSKLAKKIEKEEYSKITREELRALLPELGLTDIEQKFAKLILLLEVETVINRPETRTSLFGRMLAVQRAALADKRRISEELDRLGWTVDRLPDIEQIPHYTEKITHARDIEAVNQQNPKNYKVEPQTPEEHQLMELALKISTIAGIENVVLLNEDYNTTGVANMIGNTIYIRRDLALRFGVSYPEKGIIDEATETLIHEIGELLFHLSVMRKRSLDKGETFIPCIILTHTPKGGFAEALKYVAARSLANDYYSSTAISKPAFSELDSAI